MISYFKYTNGESFKLGDENYEGFFHVENGVARTGKFTNDGDILTSKGNFISEFYLKKFEFDTSFNNISSIQSYYSNSFDLFNKQELDSIFDKINHNNLIVFKNLVIQNPKVFNIEESSMHFYALSSTSKDVRDNDDIYGKTGYTQTDTFDETEWDFLDKINNGSFIVDARDNFLYYTTEDVNGTSVQRVLSGNFLNSSPLAVVESSETISIDYHFDDINHLLYVINQNNIEVYDTSNYPTCQNFILTDNIPISASRIPSYKWNTTFEDWNTIPITWNFQWEAPNTDIIPKFIRIGNNIRVELNSSTIFLMNRNSTEIYSSYSLEELGIGNIQALDIRAVDDAILLIHEKNSNLFVTFFDGFNVKSTIYEKRLDGISEVKDVSFSSWDSNIFYLSNASTLETRTISAPSQPVGTVNYDDLLYLRNYSWSDTFERWNQIQIKWNSNTEPSNRYNNIITNLKIYNDHLYVMLHNVGRLYAIKQPLQYQYLNALDLDVEKEFDGLTCSDSSIGLYLNTSLTSIIKDVLTLHAKSKYRFSFGGGYPETEIIDNLVFETKNLFLNGNETINVVSIQRIFSLITEIQKKLLATQS